MINDNFEFHDDFSLGWCQVWDITITITITSIIMMFDGLATWHWQEHARLILILITIIISFITIITIIIITMLIIRMMIIMMMFGWVCVGQRQRRHAQLITGKVREAHYGSILTLLRMIVMMMSMMMMIVMMMMTTTTMMVMMMMSNHCSSILNAHNDNKNYPDY